MPREEVVIQVDLRSVGSGNMDGGEGGWGGKGAMGVVPEQIVTWAVSDNIASCRVMEKAGFGHLVTWMEGDLRDSSLEVELKSCRYFV